jgi:hypothetical protein
MFKRAMRVVTTRYKVLMNQTGIEIMCYNSTKFGFKLFGFLTLNKLR